MKALTVIIGILGAIAGGMLGLKWRSDIETVQFAKALGMWSSELNKVEIAANLLVICAVLGAVVSIFILLDKGSKKIAGTLLIAAGTLPVLASPKALFGLPMVLAGVMAFFLEIKAPAHGQVSTSQESEFPPVRVKGEETLNHRLEQTARNHTEARTENTWLHERQNRRGSVALNGWERLGVVFSVILLIPVVFLTVTYMPNYDLIRSTSAGLLIWLALNGTVYLLGWAIAWVTKGFKR